MKIGKGCRALTLAGVLSLAACSKPHAAPAEPVLRAGPPVVSTAGKTPRSRQEFTTTDPAIAVNNLVSGINATESRLAAAPAGAQASVQSALVGQLLLRGQLLGQIADYERAAQLAEEVVAGLPNDPNSYLLRAATDSRFHQFARALDDVAKAQALGASPDAIAEQRAALAEQTGEFTSAIAYRQTVLKLDPNTGNLMAMAVLKGETGATKEAAAFFVQAQDSYRDVSPFAVATLYFQEGLMWEREGNWARARELYIAAHERLPQYCAVTSHLASVLAMTGEREQAVGLVRPLLERSDDPEYFGQLVQLLELTGKRDEAKTLAPRARSAYEALVKKHPEGFADHAARFYLGSGRDPARALTLAKINNDNRRTPESYQLTIDAALAAKDMGAACVAADRLERMRIPTAAAQFAIATAHHACATN